MKFHLVQNRKGNCHHNHIPFNLKGNGILVFSVYNFKPNLPASKIGQTYGRIELKLILRRVIQKPSHTGKLLRWGDQNLGNLLTMK